MVYLVKKDFGPTKKDPRVTTLYVADTHTFDLKGKRLITLTDLKEYAEEFTIEDASAFIKKFDGFLIDEEEEYWNE